MSKRSLPTKPRLRACFDVIFMEDQRCQIRSGEDLIIMLQGRTVSELFPRLLRDLTGDLSLSELAERYRAEIEFDDMILIMTQLNDEGILEDASCKSSTLTDDDFERYRSQMTFFSHFVPNRFASQEKLAGATVAVVGSGFVHAAACASLARMGVGVLLKAATGARDTPLDCAAPDVETSCLGVSDRCGDLADVAQRCDVIVSASDSPAPSLHEDIHRLSLKLGVPWITCGPLNSIEGLVGPFFVPHETCCYFCYQSRLKGNLTCYEEHAAFEAYVKENEGRTAEFGFLHPFPMIIGNLLALEVVKHVTGFATPVTYGAVISLNLLTLRLEQHEIFKLPRCEECSAVAGAPPRSLWRK